MVENSKGESAMPLTIRKAAISDLPHILAIYGHARRFMAENSNPSQWKNNYPQPSLLEADIRNGQLYAVLDNTRICGVFMFSIGDDPTYASIEDGAWQSNDAYGTIHRIAGDGTGGIFTAAVTYCRQLCPHLRLDTHQDNKPMQHLAQKHGFRRCGIIYTHDGTPRIAYELLP